MTLLIVHFALLAWISHASARRLVQNWIDRILGGALLFWGNIVLNCLLLSQLGKLGEPDWFFRTSLLLGLLTLWLVWRGTGSVPADPALPAEATEKRSRWLMAGVFGSLFLILLANLRMAAVYPPNNYDSLAYHLPRVMYYLGQNSLAHFETADIRQVYFTFNYNLLQLACFIYSPPHQAINFLNVAAWVLTGLAVYRVSRFCGCSFNASLFAAWLTLTATGVIAQATATALDLPTAAALLSVVVFALRWRQANAPRDALLAGVAAGLAAGAKLTVVFFGPAVVLLLVVLLYQSWRRSATPAYFRAAGTWIGPGLVAVVLSVPFILYNLAATGQWMTKLLDFTLNKPFSLASALQTAKTYLFQLFFEPLGRFAYDLEWIAQLNQWFSHTFFSGWNPAYAYSDFYVIPPDLNEDHVWYGFTGPLFLICGALCLWRDRRLQGPLAWLALLGLGWFATYFGMNKWSMYTQRYFLPALVLMAPCAAAVWDRRPGAAPLLAAARRGVFYLVSATALWFAFVYLGENRNRPFAFPWSDFTAPIILPEVPPLLRDRIHAEPKVNIITDGTNERIFLLMNLGSNQRFTSGTEVDPEKYNIFSFWSFTRNNIYSNIAHIASHIVVAVPGKKTAGVEFLGTIGLGVNAFDYVGLVPHANEAPATSKNRNIVVLVRYAPTEPNRFMFCSLRVNGLNPDDDARVMITADMTDGSQIPLMAQDHSGEIRFGLAQPFKRLRIEVLDRTTGRLLGAGELPYSTRPTETELPAASSVPTRFRTELVAAGLPRNLTVRGLADAEGPYAKWDLPLIRWQKQPSVRIELPPNQNLKLIRFSFGVRLQVRDQARLQVLHNGQLLQEFDLRGQSDWHNYTVEFTPSPGANVIELRDRPDNQIPDWLAYLEQNPDVKTYVLSQNVPLETGGKDHYETFGRKENRPLPMKANPAAATVPPDSLYFLYRSLLVEGFSN